MESFSSSKNCGSAVDSFVPRALHQIFIPSSFNSLLKEFVSIGLQQALSSTTETGLTVSTKYHSTSVFWGRRVLISKFGAIRSHTSVTLFSLTRLPEIMKTIVYCRILVSMRCRKYFGWGEEYWNSLRLTRKVLFLTALFVVLNKAATNGQVVKYRF